MFKSDKKVTIEWEKRLNNNKTDKKYTDTRMSNSITAGYSDSDKLALMIKRILHEELPMIKDNSLLYNLVLYTLIEKMKTVQSVENVLSYIKDKHAKRVDDVLFCNGEIYIRCSI